MKKELRISMVSVLFLPLFLGACQFFERGWAQDAKKTAPAVNPAEDPGVMGARRQLTQVGPRSGEAYFSPDGRQLIFQSEREPGNPFYQIYSLDLVTGQTQRLSTGNGKTTCSWFHPSMKKALFSSTHQDPGLEQKVQEEFADRKKPQKGKYSWSFDETFDIYEVNLKTKALKPLTREKGYDAEASYSPDGQWIAFASNRTGYTEKLTDDEQKLFTQDPSSQMEIYRMRADGTQVQRLTKSLGYDGGPFFSADGSKITWRRFNPQGTQAEIWVMNADGSEPRAVTKLGAMSWAPFFHPTGDYLIFTTNKMGFANFELYIVDVDGKNEPQRVSFIEGFDGLPVFSPDGTQLVWTHRDEKGESQLVQASWDDAKAREFLKLPARLPRTRELAKMQPTEALRALVGSLASTDRAGRMTGSAEEAKLAGEIAALFQELKLKPWSGTDFQMPFEFASGVNLGPQTKATLTKSGKSAPLKTEVDFTPLSFSATGEFTEAAVAFAGYGIVAPASDTQPAYDSFKDLDVKDKWVLVLEDIPDDIPNPRRIFLNQVSRLHHKALAARQAGARGLLVTPGAHGTPATRAMKLRFDGSFAQAGLPVVMVSNDVAEALLRGSGKKLAEWQKSLEKGDVNGLAEIPETKWQASIDLQDIKGRGHNVVAVLNVPNAKGTILIGAHGDHLGRGVAGSSLARGAEVGQVHFGADDNASGVAAVLTMAQNLTQEVRSQKLKLTHNIAFAVWSGEEIGLLGSAAFLKENKTPIQAYLNLDMVGRLRENLVVQSAGSALEWRPKLEGEGIRERMPITVQDDPYQPSDSMSFYLKGIPALTFFTGAHGEYHTPRDRPETLNYEGLAKVRDFVQGLAVDLAQTQPLKLTYQKSESTRQQLPGRSFRVYLGTIPDYTQEKVKGVRISGTSKGSPAEKAGLVEGDVLREMAGTKIENIYDYVYILQALKPNQKVDLQIERKGQTMKLEITPTLKE